MRIAPLLAGFALVLGSAGASLRGAAPRPPGLARLVPNGAAVQVLAEGFQWAEGPVWIAQGGYLLFSDVPKNRIYRWVPGNRAASVFLEPSGGTATTGFREPGSNGLKIGAPGLLLVADQGNRAIALRDRGTTRKRLVAGRFGGKKFMSR